MFGLKKLFKQKISYASLVQQGAAVTDVRSAAEFAGGHIPGSRNISIENIKDHIKELQQLNKPVIICCHSGVRSAIATRMLKAAGIESHNGGSWNNLKKTTGMRYAKRLLTEWNVCRIVRSIAGISFMVYGIQLQAWPVIIFGFAWLAAGLFSLQCCSGSSCYNSANNRSLPADKPVDFKEIK